MKINFIKSKYCWILLGILILAAWLRFYNLTSNPPSPYWEEAALGYDAYSILQTGQDHHGNAWPIVAFESFGDWKPSLYFYTSVPSIAVFGLNVWAVRQPSALVGTITVGLLYLLVKNLFTKNKKKKLVVEVLALLSALFLAIMPWHVLVSRVGFETNLALFLVVLGSWLFIKSLQDKKGYLLVLSAIPLALSCYAYHSSRVVVPLLIMGMGIILGKKLWQLKQWLLASLVLGLILLLPILVKYQDPQIRQRFNETSALTTLDPILSSNQAMAADNNNLWSRLLHHRFWYYGEIIADNYFDHFDPIFLIIEGDANQRHSFNLVGQIYWLQLFLILLGLFYIFFKKQWELLSILWWLLVAPIAAAITISSPHGLRALLMVVPLAILSAYGLLQLILGLNKFLTKNLKNSIRKILILGFGGLILFSLTVEVTRFWHYYNNFNRQAQSEHWQFGYGELMEFIANQKDNYEQIIITRDQGRPAMYYWFYAQTDPELVQVWNNRAPKDQGEYLQFENIYFGTTPEKLDKHLLVSSNKQNEGNLIKEIKRLNGETVFYIYENL